MEGCLQAQSVSYLRSSYFLYFFRIQNSGVGRLAGLLKFQICDCTNMKPSKLKKLLSSLESHRSTCLLNLPVKHSLHMLALVLEQLSNYSAVILSAEMAVLRQNALIDALLRYKTMHDMRGNSGMLTAFNIHMAVTHFSNMQQASICTVVHTLDSTAAMFGMQAQH